MFSCDDSCHRLSLELGADEFVRKDSPIEQLIDHLRPAVV
jgi:hypothetical protein